MAPTLEKYRLLNEEEADTINRDSNSAELTGHEYLTRQEVSTYNFSKLTIIVTVFLFVISVASNIIMALALKKAWVPTLPVTKLGEYFVMDAFAFLILILNA